MMAKPHYFIAISLAKEIREKIAHWSEMEKPPFQRFVHPTDYHITLVFLGGINEELLNGLKQSMMERATKHQPFTLTVSHLDYFGNGTSPKVLWAGVEHSDQLIALQNDIFHHCLSFTGSLDERPYRPHITIARNYKCQSPFDEESFSHSFQTFVKHGSWDIHQLVLYQTHLNRIPKYEVIAQFPLGSEVISENV